MYNTLASYSWYHQAINNNGIGGMGYYTSLTCGYNGNSWIYDGCTTDYNSSEVKYVVDAWASAKFTNELKPVDGYSARLAQKEELRTIGWPSCSSTATSCSKESTTPSWVYTNKYWYWTMSQWNSSSTYVWIVNGLGNLSYNYVNYNLGGAVRPVINVYKSKLS